MPPVDGVQGGPEANPGCDNSALFLVWCVIVRIVTKLDQRDAEPETLESPQHWLFPSGSGHGVHLAAFHYVPEDSHVSIKCYGCGWTEPWKFSLNYWSSRMATGSVADST